MSHPFRMLVTAVTTLAEAVDFVLAHMFSKEGAQCPCCGGLAKVKSYAVGGQLAYGLQLLYNSRPAPLHVKQFAGDSRMHGILRHAGLIEQPTGDPSKPFNRSGYWVITDRGVDWIEGRTTIPQHIHVMYKTLIGGSIEQITFAEALARNVSPEDAMEAVDR